MQRTGAYRFLAVYIIVLAIKCFFHICLACVSAALASRLRDKLTTIVELVEVKRVQNRHLGAIGCSYLVRVLPQHMQWLLGLGLPLLNNPGDDHRHGQVAKLILVAIGVAIKLCADVSVHD